MYSDYLITKGFNFISGVPSQKKFDCNAKFRYRQDDQAVSVTILDNGDVRIDFKERQRAVTLGQYAVLYDGDICLGGGKIAYVYNELLDFKVENSL